MLKVLPVEIVEKVVERVVKENFVTKEVKYVRKKGEGLAKEFEKRSDVAKNVRCVIKNANSHAGRVEGVLETVTQIETDANWKVVYLEKTL